jgi:hypothetical protein
VTHPTPWRPPKTLKFSESEQQALDQAVDKFLKAKVIEEAPNQQENQFLSRLFTIQEPTKIRPILDCKRINNFIQCLHFKMEGIPALRDLVEKDDFMTKIDLKDAYTVVPIHPQSRKYLAFSHRNKVYHYSSLAFGLSVAPRIFSKLMRYAAEPLRQTGIYLVYYLDDLCILTKSVTEAHRVTTQVLQHLQQLGFLINWEKSSIQAKHVQEFLGFVFDTKKMTIQVPTLKLTKLISRIRQLKRAQEISQWKSCRWIAALLGKMTAMLPAIGEALLHLRYLQRDLAISLRRNRQNWEGECMISEKAMEELNWWSTIAATRNGLEIHTPPPQPSMIDIYVDASNTGWGVYSKLIQTSGFWTKEEEQQHINVKELQTILFAIQLHAKRFKNLTITIHSDNTPRSLEAQLHQFFSN